MQSFAFKDKRILKFSKYFYVSVFNENIINISEDGIGD